MNAGSIAQFRPFVSVMLIVCTLLGVVFLQMEERRLGYTLLKLSRVHREILEEKRGREIQLAKITRPQLVERMAQHRFTLKKVTANQIIHLPGNGMRTASANERRPASN